MKWLIIWQENLVKRTREPMSLKLNIITLLIIFFLFTPIIVAKETWILDKEISTITFELPVFLAKNVKGEFTEIEGLTEIDVEEKENNKAVFTVNIDSIEMNYKKYRNLLLSDIFFYEKKFPIALIDTKKFSYENEKELELMVELNIKGTTKEVPLQLTIIRLGESLVQIKGSLNFSRTAYQIGIGKWSSTAILKDKATINTNLFLFKD